jgi:hypothetical protein
MAHVDIDALTRLHDWMRSHHVTECRVGDVHLILKPAPVSVAVMDEPTVTDEERAELDDLLWGTSTSVDDILRVRKSA